MAETIDEQAFGNMGMTLRDYFAAKAMPVLMARYSGASKYVGTNNLVKDVALDAYAQADAMLKRRVELESI